MKKIVIIGVGALGSHLVLLIRNLPGVSIKVIDMDRVETKNVMSQFHTKMGVGKNKAQALQQTLSGLFGIKVDAVPHRLTVDNVDALLGGADLVVDCLDNAASRQVVQDYVRKKGIACLHGALDPDGQFGRSVFDEMFVIDHEGTVGAATCEDGRHLVFIARASSYLADSVQKFIEKGKKVGYQIHPGGVTII